MPDIEWNREVWDQTHDWSADGDEWSGMAQHCHQPYAEWKDALVAEFLLPQLGPEVDVLEVAPGHGRFSEFIVADSASATLVDLSQTCLDICRSRFGDDGTVRYVLTEGTTLPGVANESIDFVWSFDSFVHMEPEVIDAYLGEFARALRPGGTFTLHHAGKRNWSLRAVPLTSRLGRPGRVAQRLLSQARLHDSGRRANVSRQLVSTLAAHHGLEITSQRQSWGPSQQYDVAKFGDWITSGRRPAADSLMRS